MADLATQGRQVGSQQVDIPVEAAEDAESMRKKSDEEVCTRINLLADTSDEHAAPRHQTFDRMYRMYLSRFNFTGKAQWQSKAPVPRLFNLLENACAIFAGAMMPGARWFSVRDTWMRDSTRALMVQQMMESLLEDHVALDLLLRPTLLTGMIGGMAPVKVGVDSSGKIPFPSLELWDPRDVKLDFTGRGRFMILDTEVDPYMLEEWAEDGLFDMDRVKDAVDSARADASGGDFDTVSKSLHWREFWGDLPDRDGKAIIRNGHGIIINKRILLRPLIDNPFNHGRLPVVLGCPLRVPFKLYPPGLAEHVSGLVLMLTELANNVLDATLYASVQAYMYDIDRVDPADIRRGIWPGRAFGVEDLAQGPGIQRFEAGEVPLDAMAIGQWLDNEISRDTNISENATGIETPGSRRKTAREVVTRTGQSMTILRTMARDQELTFLQPVLNTLLSVFAQVTLQSRRFFSSPETIEILGPAAALLLAQCSAEQRAELLTKGMRFRAFGVSGSLALNEDLQRLLGMAEVLSRDPQGMWPMVKKAALARKIVEAHRQVPDDILYTEQQMAQMAAQVQAAAGGGGAAGPMPGPGIPAFLQGARPNRLMPPLRPPMRGQPRALPAMNPNVVMRGT